MPIVVNTNISSINAQRSLTKVNKGLDQAMERLASGLRINRSADDAAGLAIATGLSSQIRGLSQATRNARDGLSVIGMADGAVNSQTEILQRIRELAVQAANDTNSSANRQSIQAEIDEQVQELTRVGNTVEFNGKNLLNGTYQNQQLQVGAYAEQTISISIGDFRAAGMGQLAEVTGISDPSTASGKMKINSGAIDGSVDTSAGGKGVLITSPTSDGVAVAVGASTVDGVSSHYADASAIAKANAINEVSGQTGVTATVEAAELVGTTALSSAAAIGTTTTLTINGVTVVDGSVDNWMASVGDSSGKLRTEINRYSNETGVVATLDGTGAAAKAKLTAEDGRNIVVDAAGTATAIGFTAQTGSTVAAAVTHLSTGVLKLSSNEQFDVQSDSTNATNLLGISSANAANDLVTVAVDPNKAVNTIDVTTSAGAGTAIQIIDSALSQVADAQAELGAITNRLENTIQNLAVSIENLTASESRIRDADFAVETAKLTRSQIIQQAATSILAQANLRPQAALALLGG